MKITKLLTLSGLVLSALLFGCKKDGNPVPPPVSGEDSTHPLHINLTYLSPLNLMQYDSLKKYELIVTEAGGKVLLDTISAFNTPVIADLVAKKQLVDVSVVHYPGSPGHYRWEIYTYKAVDPSLWVTLPLSDSIVHPPAPTYSESASVTYLNSPVNMSELLWFSMLSDHASGGYANGNNTLTELYDNNKYAYLLFPIQQLYKLQKVKQKKDTIDLTKMDTAEKITFKLPAQYTHLNYSLFGYPDSTDPNTSLFLFASGTLPDSSGTAIVYPGKKSFQKYDFNAYAYSDNTFNSASCSFYKLDTLPVTLPLPDQSYYNLSSVQSDNVSVSFTHKPTNYSITSSFNSQSQFILVAPADSTVLHPLSVLTSLKSKLMKDVNFSSLKPSIFGLTIEGSSDYMSYWIRHTNNTQAANGPQLSLVSMYHYF